MKLLVINNLASGYGGRPVYDFIRAFCADSDEICLRTTDGTTDVADLLGDAASFDAVVASGGDGTIAAVNYALANTGTPVLPLPAGTANLLIQNLSSPTEPYALASMVREGRTLDFDLGEIEVAQKTLGFEIMAGAGYDAAIMRDAEPLKHKMGQMAYAAGVLSNVMPQTAHITLTIDGRTIESEGLGVLLVNFAQLQYEISVTHKNEPRDGEFDVVILKAQNAFELIPAVIAALRDLDNEHPDRTDILEIHQGKEVFVECDPPLEVQYDGEPTGLTTPFRTRVVPQAARMFVSEEGYQTFAGEDAPAR